MRVVPAHIDVACVVPALRAVLKQVDGTDGKGLALYDGIRAARWQRRIWHKGKRLKRTARSKRSRSGKRVVDEVRPLQVKPTRAEIAYFERCVPPEALLH